MTTKEHESGFLRRKNIKYVNQYRTNHVRSKGQVEAKKTTTGVGAGATGASDTESVEEEDTEDVAKSEVDAEAGMSKAEASTGPKQPLNRRRAKFKICRWRWKG